MRRGRIAVAALLVGGFLLGTVTAASGAVADSCDSTYVAPMNSDAKLKAWESCRFDRLDAGQKQILGKLNAPDPTSSPTAPASTPAPTPTPTGASPSPTAAPSPTATATGGGVCDPNKAVVTFTGQGSQGLGGGYDASAEEWGVTGYNYAQTMGACSHASWYVNVTTDNTKGDGAVKAYPSMRRIYHDWSTSDFSKDPRLSSFPRLDIDFAATDPASCAGCIYDDAFDIWLNGIGGSNNTELMVWTHNASQTPYGSKVASGVNLNGHTWDLYSGNSDHYVAYVPTDTANISAGNLDVKAFAKDLIARGRMATTTLTGGQTDPYVGQLSYGVETVSTGAVSKHWDFTDFTVHDS